MGRRRGRGGDKEEEEEEMRGGLNISSMNEAVCLAAEGAVGEEPDVFDHQSAETERRLSEGDPALAAGSPDSAQDSDSAVCQCVKASPHPEGVCVGGRGRRVRSCRLGVCFYHYSASCQRRPISWREEILTLLGADSSPTTASPPPPPPPNI